MDRASLGDRLDGPRLTVVTNRGEFRAAADRDGNYLYSPDSKKFDQVQSFVSAQRTLDLFEGYAERPLPWSFEGQLGVIPHAGEGKNAYYARWNESVSFYEFASRALGKTVYVAQSADVVSHETGHAILDGMKPEWGKTFDKETKGMHEAFGDCAAMLMACSRPENRAQALKESADLRTDNVIASIAEEFGTAVRLDNRDPNDDRPYLRNSLNAFTYVPPDQLPADAPREELSAEAHSFCQVFTRAFYDSLVGVFEDYRKEGLEPDQALEKAADSLGSIFARGVTMSAPNRARYADVALGMLRADQLQGGEHQPTLRRAFLQSKILSPEALARFDAPLPQGQPEDVLKSLDLEGFQKSGEVADREGYRTLEFTQTQKSTKAQFFAEGGPDLTVDVTAGASLTYDASGKLVHLAVQKAEPAAEWQGIDGASLLSGDQAFQDYQLLSTADGYRLEKLPIFWD